MPSPKKSCLPYFLNMQSKSPGRRMVTRSRSRSRGRPPKAAVAAGNEVEAQEAPPSRIPRRSASRSPARVKQSEKVTVQRSSRVTKAAAAAEVAVTETVLTQRSSTTSVAEVQQQASVTPVRTSARIASILEKEREAADAMRAAVKADAIASMTTPTKDGAGDAPSKAAKGPSYEFIGPVGALVLIFSLPLTVYYLNMACRKGKCSISVIPKMPKSLANAFFDVEVTLIFLAWLAFQALLAVLPVGRLVNGQPLKAGGRLQYRCNGFFSLVVSLAALAGAVYMGLPVTMVVDKFFKFMTSAIIFSFMLSVCLYIKSFLVEKKKLAKNGDTGNFIYDFFIGRELNPRIGPLDLKFFFELRPGLIGWVVLDWAMVVAAWQKTGELPPTLLTVTCFQTLYVADALWNEDAILTTMDIIHDGFGYMLCFGDVAWVPFMYSLQPRFLLESGFSHPWYILAPIVALNLLGYIIFRLSNSQKDRFRKDPKNPAVADVATISTPSGKKLLVGGWWGLCRKPNYLGDLIMALAWSLCTGFDHVIPYFYPLYFLILLVHRERRDNEQCQDKHGKAWDKYCQMVPYRIFPKIY